MIIQYITIKHIFNSILARGCGIQGCRIFQTQILDGNPRPREGGASAALEYPGVCRKTQPISLRPTSQFKYTRIRGGGVGKRQSVGVIVSWSVIIPLPTYERLAFRVRIMKEMSKPGRYAVVKTGGEISTELLRNAETIPHLLRNSVTLPT